MKYGLIPTNLIERLALWSGKLPVPMIDALFGPIKTRAIMAGVSLGVFESLRDGRHTASAVAARLQLDADALELLMRTLVMCDYLEQHGNEFALSSLARQTMIEGAPMELVGYMKFNYEQWDFIGHLEEMVRTGRGVDFHETMTSPESWQHYQQGMLEAARFLAPVLASRVPVPKGATAMLDLAGSHGLLGAAICRRHPPMTSTVLDLPQAIPHARELARREQITDVVTHREGDLLAGQYGSNYDVVLAANILHHFAPETNVTIIGRIRDAMRPGSTVAIWEIEAPRRGSPVTSGDGAALYFRLTSTAATYHGGEYAEWLTAAGFQDVRIARPLTTPGSVLITGTRG